MDETVVVGARELLRFVEQESNRPEAICPWCGMTMGNPLHTEDYCELFPFLRRLGERVERGDTTDLPDTLLGFPVNYSDASPSDHKLEIVLGSFNDYDYSGELD